MKHACQYAIVRFMPFVETGEFANVGIVLMCPEKGYFNFQLLNRVRRITAFFDQLDARIYREAKNDLRDELNRVKALIAQGANQEHMGRFLFQELIRPREVMLQFDAARVVLADEPEKKLEQLFNFYVERDFVTPEYIEQRLETKLRGILVQACLRDKYQETKVECGAFHARFPFAHRDDTGQIRKAIKAMHLAHKDPASAYEHGWVWVGKLHQLRKHGALPQEVLIATQGPDENNHEGIAIYQEIKEDFTKLDVQVISLAQVEEIQEFARLQ